MIREFRLSPPGSGCGVSCDANGAFVGTVPLLKRSNSGSSDRWEPCDCGEVSKQVGAEFGLPIDMSAKSGGLRAISNALNEGDVARAQIATVLLGIPDPPPPHARTRNEMIKFIRDLHWSGMIESDDGEDRLDAPDPAVDLHLKTLTRGACASVKAGFNPDEPRDERGRWAEGGSADSDKVGVSAGTQLADAGMSDASDDPVVQAAARAAGSIARSKVKPTGDAHDDFWQTLGSRIAQEAQSALSDIGRAQINESNADRGSCCHRECGRQNIS
jgi:hypothetical protein